MRLDGALMKAGHDYFFYNYYETSIVRKDNATIESKSLTLALSPSINLKEEQAIVELGININLFSWVNYHGEIYHYYNYYNGQEFNESKTNVNLNELLTPYNMLKGKTMFFSIFLTYNYKMFKK
jgi:hypothetical protein